MRAQHQRLAVALVGALLCGAALLGARGPAAGVVPPNARIHGFSLLDLATAYNAWAWGTSAEVNPLLAVRCERSPVDPNIWFMPVSLGGETTGTCQLPPGAFLVVTPGSVECSNIEPDPFFGADEAGLTACVDGWFALLNHAEVIIDGDPVTNLDDYALRTRAITLPPNNLLNTESGLSMSEGYFLVVRPLSRGTHTLRLYDEFESMDFKAGLTLTLVVG
jgi:hypothetical protein